MRPFSPKQVLPDIKQSANSKRQSEVSSSVLTSCMDEKDIAISVIHGKKKVKELFLYIGNLIN